ncbi:methyltransferase-like protein 13 isoform X1 [Varroa jacobsoni]|uniref:methyltransferase-like protein 13 isoform X1 n=2 Tax=Varroa jacobsoni TaxID=62625 RepID=UPI000BF87DA2|nr:methyltransferase-like protein 13 isoform X1 [Varroa jacobsoni]
MIVLTNRPRIMEKLLPKTSSEFTSKEYWDCFFNRRESAFEWYGEYHQLSPIVFKYAKPSDRILVVGCGNSAMSYDLHQSGYKNVVSIDISDIVINQMKKKYPELDFRHMDATKLEFSDSEFNIVIDKGTIDSLLPNFSKKNITTVEKVLSEITRCLRHGGRFMCVTLLQNQVSQVLFGFFSQSVDDVTWVVRVHRCVEAEDTRHEFTLPVYVVVVTKMRRLPVGPYVFESMVNINAKSVRHSSVEALLADIKDQQSYAFLRNHLCHATLDKECRTELYSAESDKPKYELFIVDTPGADRQSGLKFACFIVPEGRESEWLFGTTEGRKLSAKQCRASRVVFVHLSRSFTYNSIEEIKDELSAPIRQLTPKSYKQGSLIPFLSAGKAANNRTLIEKNYSPISGDFVIEDVKVGNEIYRRLIFLDRPSVIQTEMRVYKTRVDYTYLSSEYYKFMVAALGFFGNQAGSALLLGLGGGMLASYTAKYAKWKVQAVELDQAVIDVAKKHFGLVENVETECGDALDFVRTSKEKFDIIWLDIDSKDVSHALTCPPEAFLQEEFLKNVERLLRTKGVFVLNLACRDENKCKDVYKTVADNFRNLKMVDVPTDTNQVIYASNSNSLECNVKEIRSLLKRFNKDNDVEDFEKMLQNIEL